MFHGQADTAIILLDRSASMQQQQVQTGQSKRSTALSKLAELFDSQGAGTQLVLIESTENRALPIDSLDAILESPATSATSTAADIPRLLQTALDYVVDNQVGRTDIWICSDLRENSSWRSPSTASPLDVRGSAASSRRVQTRGGLGLIGGPGPRRARPTD